MNILTFLTRHARAGLSALLTVLLVALTALPPAAPPPVRADGTTYYVRDGADGTGCTSWADACDTLQDALGKASSGDAIWVAAGVYYPDEGHGQTNNDRTSTFSMTVGITIYGGFPSSGTPTKADRDWETHVTILSGDIDRNDTNDDGNYIAEISYDIWGNNAYHVVTVADDATLDGMTITAGNADGTDDDTFGGGMLNRNSNPTLTNVTFSGNYADYGGGMANENSSNPTLTNVTFSGNYAVTGGGMYNDSSNPTLTNVTFVGNFVNQTYFYQVSGGGGGMYNESSHPTLTSVTFSKNRAEGYFGKGGGMCNSNSNPTLTNVTFSSNRTRNGGGIFNTGSSPTLMNVTFSGNQSSYGGGMFNTRSTPILTNVTFSGNRIDYFGGGMFNTGSNPTLTNVIFLNNDGGTYYGGGMFNDNSHPTLTNVTFSGNRVDYYGGGMYNISSHPTLTNVTFSGNRADHDGEMANENSSNPSLTGYNYVGIHTDYGGGMYNSSSNPTLTNVTFSGNRADHGGGMYNRDSNPTLTNVTFSGNRADYGGGMYNHSNSHPTIQNSIIWGNYAEEKGEQLYNYPALATTSLSYTLVEGSGGSGAGWDTDLGTDSGNNLDADPYFLNPVAASEAPTTAGNYRLRADSPAIDAGDNTLLFPDVTTDLDGYARFVDMADVTDTGAGTAPIVDLGAYEVEFALALDKTVNNGSPAPSNIITYTLTLSNNGELNATNVLVSDTLPTGLAFVPGSFTIDGAAQPDPALPILLDIANLMPRTTTIMCFAAQVAVEVAEGTPLTNLATLTSDEETTPHSSRAVLTTVAATPTLAISITPSRSSAEVGDVITYTYRLVNTGNVTLDSVTTTDDRFGSVTLDLHRLAIGAAVSSTLTDMVSKGDLPGPLVNTVTTKGTSPAGDEVNDTAQVSVTLNHSPAMAISVTPGRSSVEVGDVITYTYQITNTGDVTLNSVTATDERLGPVTLDKRHLAPGVVVSGTLTSTVSEHNLPGPLANTVMARGTSPADKEVSDTDGVSVTLTSSPAITISVTPSVSSAEEGDVITYTYQVINSGNVTLNSVTVTDDWLGPVTLDKRHLAPGAAASGTLTHTVSGADLPGPLANTVTASGTPLFGDLVSGATSTQVSLTSSPAIALSVTPNTTSTMVGKVITYTYRVTNTGNVTLHPVVVTDNQFGVVTLASNRLAPGTAASGTLTHTVREADLPGPLANTVGVTGTPPAGSEVSATASTSVGLRSGSANAPTLTMASVIEVWERGATLYALVNPHGLDTKVTFTWGEVSHGPYSDGQMLHDPFNGTEVQSASLRLRRLTPDTTYFYFATARNADGSATSVEQQFTTTTIASRPAYLSTPPVGSTLVIGTAAITATGTTTLYVREVGSAHLEVNLANPALSGADEACFRMVSPTRFPFTIADGSDKQVALTVACTPLETDACAATLTLKTNDPMLRDVHYLLRCVVWKRSGRIYLPLVQR